MRCERCDIFLRHNGICYLTLTNNFSNLAFEGGYSENVLQTEKNFFDPLAMNFLDQNMIFGEKGLEIDT